MRLILPVISFGIVVLWLANTVVADKLPPGAKAVAVVQPTAGNSASGTVRFFQTDNQVVIRAQFKGLTPGKHGFHIHQFGDCSAADGTSAGGHFNPHDKPHGAPDTAERHVGDLGNLVADAQGNASYDRPLSGAITLKGDTSIVGRAIIVHEKADDLTSQPTGAAGKRVACGVIGVGSAS